MSNDSWNVLIVDDAQDFRELLRLCLARNSQINIVGEASNGIEGVAATVALSPDVVILDLSMPVMDGLQAAPLIKKKRPAVRIVVLTGFEASEMEAKALAAGADAFVEKSAVLTELERAIFGVLERSGGRAL